MESLIKQFNRRVKGTEKFWNQDQAEMILQLRAAELSEADRLAKHLKSRPISPFRTYKTTGAQENWVVPQRNEPLLTPNSERAHSTGRSGGARGRIGSR